MPSGLVSCKRWGFPIGPKIWNILLPKNILRFKICTNIVTDDTLHRNALIMTPWWLFSNSLMIIWWLFDFPVRKSRWQLNTSRITNPIGKVDGVNYYSWISSNTTNSYMYYIPHFSHFNWDLPRCFHFVLSHLKLPECFEIRKQSITFSLKLKKKNLLWLAYVMYLGTYLWKLRKRRCRAANDHGRHFNPWLAHLLPHFWSPFLSLLCKISIQERFVMKSWL